MHKFNIAMAAFISIIMLPATAFADKVSKGHASASTNAIKDHAINDDGFYIDLPSINYRHLLNEISTINRQLSEREVEIKQYLDKNRLNSKDALITAIMPGGLLYAAVRKGNLDQARTKLDKLAEYKDELSHDLLAAQAMLNTYAVAHANQ